MASIRAIRYKTNFLNHWAQALWEQGGKAAFAECYRVGDAVMPVLTLYKPFGQLVSLAGGLTKMGRAWGECQAAFKSGEARRAAGFQALFATTCFTLKIVGHPLSRLLANGQEALLSGRLVGQALYARQYRVAGKAGFQLLGHALELGVFVSGSGPLVVASLAVQIFQRLGESSTHFSQGNYLKACCLILASGVQSHRLHQQVRLQQAVHQLAAASKPIHAQRVGLIFYDGMLKHVAYYEGKRVVITVIHDSKNRLPDGFQVLVENEKIISQAMTMQKGIIDGVPYTRHIHAHYEVYTCGSNNTQFMIEKEAEPNPNPQK